MGEGIQARATDGVKRKDSALWACIEVRSGFRLTFRDAIQGRLLSALLAAAPGGVTKQSLMTALYGPKRPGRPSMSMLSVNCRIINAALARHGAAVRLDYWRRADVALVPIGV